MLETLIQPVYDPTCLIYAVILLGLLLIGGVILVRVILHHKFLDILPIEQLNLQIVNNSPNPIFSVNRQGLIQGWNLACEHVFGYDSRIIGQPYRQLVDEANFELVEVLLLQVFEQGISFTDRAITFTHQSGEQRHMASRLYPLRYRTGKVKMCIVASTDITEHIQNEKALQRQLSELTVLHTIAIACVEATSEDALIERATRIIGEALYPDNFGLLMVDEKAGMILTHPSYRDWTQTAPPAMPLGTGVAGLVIQRGQPLRLDDVTQEPNYLEVDPHTRSELCVPLKAGERVLGAINAESRQLAHFSLDDERLLITLAGQLSTAIERLRAENSERQRAQELLAISRVSQEISSVLDRRQILDSIARNAAEIADAGASGIFLYQADERLRLVSAYGVGDSFVDAFNSHPLPAPGTAIDQAIETRKPYQITDLSQLPDYPAVEIAQIEQIQSVLAVPLLLGDEAIGGITIWHRHPYHFNREEERFLQALAHQSVNAIENARLFATIQHQARQVQQIIDTVPEGVLLLDEDNRIALANPEAWKLLPVLSDALHMDHPVLGQPLETLAGKPIDAFLQPGPDGRWHELHPSSTPPRTLELAARSLEIDQQRIGWVIVLRDVTQEREASRRIQMQERLATVGQLAAGIAHDFNNILAAVMVYTDILGMQPGLNPSSREYVAIIQQQIQRASSLIRQILDFSRRAIMEQSVLDLLPFMKEMEKLLERVLPENIALRFSRQPGNYAIKADPTRLQQVFMNLALNARDAMPAGGILEFALERYNLLPGEASPLPDLPAGDWVRLTVRDNGEGIPPEALSHIFDPFFTTKPVGEGNGLGLAQAYGIIKQHGGSIDVRSRPGQGTTFMIYLPALPSVAETNHETQPDIQIDANGQAILLVEDDPAAQKAIRLLLESREFQVFTAHNGIEALEIFTKESKAISLIISDVVMPEMGGVTLYQKLREIHPRLKFLFITGHPLEAKSQVLLEEARVHLLQKPFSAQTLISTLKEMLHDPG